MAKKDYFLPISVIIFSIITGFLSNDPIVGSSILATGLLCAWYGSKGKRSNYIIGFINYLLMAYVAYKNNLYGMVIFYTIIFAPLQIKGYLAWSKNLTENNDIKAREFPLKNSIIIIFSCLIGSCILAYLLQLIPSQRLAFLDALSNCINLCGVVLMILRFKEAWWIWLANNIIDLSIWIINFICGGDGAFMVLLASIGFLLINIYGIINWTIISKKYENI